MLFDYPLQPHQRKHGPVGYTDPVSFKEWLRDEFAFRCAYCLVRERWYPNGQDGFGIEHAKPSSHYPHLHCVYENLVYACNWCNSRKANELLLDPSETPFGEHLRVLPSGIIEGLTTEGWDLIRILRLNHPGILRARAQFLTLHQVARTNPENPELQRLYLGAFGFPDDLPNLAALRPPSNTRPEGVAQCYHRQRLEGRLPETY